jgi:hypothetical protein
VTTAAAIKAWDTRRADPEWVARQLDRQAGRFDQLVEMAEAVGNLAEHREITPTPVWGPSRIDAERRAILSTIIRRVDLPMLYISTGVTDNEATEDEHVVPVRVLVDRIIMKPRQARLLLETAVVGALVTKAEHRQLGSIWTQHPELYGRMLKAPVKRLHELGLRRYFDAGVELVVPS